ncbi:efflux transporter periplasmic adaptor subunit [Bacillus sp. FJAT-27225]|uniref:efflux RND transporter periplasmic adaptor subunit n=1 Tax=Bacillus sp. FJAT-27225 TaxID=1743144 RepID=UPI00080C259D|nr:efflux RND transporter periplasmic adaptor subunit [Bacillus sp. FJAT-27225]OCA83076.1 efflux transporter periplasmic adaptor subunit [Bacillus sp. FJAT-27225]
MKKKILIGTLIFLLLAGMIGVSVYREVYAEGPSVKVVEVAEDEISSFLMVPGTISLEQEQIVYPSPERGTLKEITVEEGQAIKKGTVLARFENAQLQLEKEQNTLSLESTNLRISQTESQLTELRAQEEALSGGILPDQTALAQVTAQISQLETELQIAELELKQANLQKESIGKRTAELEIKSTLDGTVLLVNEHASAAGAEPAVVVGKMDGLVAKGLLSEYDTLKVSVGQKVKVRSDAVPDQSWAGEVTKVGTLPESQAGAAGVSQAVLYPVFVKLSATNSVLKPGFQVIMEIETEKKTGIILPDSALVDDGDTQFVFVVEKGIVYRREVQTGIISGNQVEITKGLELKEKAVTNPNDKLEDGMEVTVK